MTSPLVSVLMPVFNSRRYLAAAVESIRAQTVGDFELIAVNDGSTDDSLAILNEIARAEPRLRIMNQSNTGIVGALNNGLTAAHGRFIARMDADDLCDPRRFELQIARLHAEPALVVVGSCAKAIDPDGRVLGDAPVPLSHEDIEHSHLHGDSCIYHPSVMMRRDALERLGGYRDMCPAEDFDLWLRMGEIGRLANLSERLFIWRRTVSGIVATSLDRRRAAVQQALADAWQRRGLGGPPTKPVQRYESRSDLYRQWAWMALRSSEFATSRLYARKALLAAPWSPSSWRLAFCAARGY